MIGKMSMFLKGFFVFTVASFFSYSLVFALPSVNQYQVNIHPVSKLLFSDSLQLSSNIVFVENSKIDTLEVTSECNIHSSIISNTDELSLFELKVIDANCDKENLDVNFLMNGISYNYNYKIISAYKLYSIFLDKPNTYIDSMIQGLNKRIEGEFINYTGIKKVETQNKKEQLIYLRDFLQNIKIQREKKYILPVKGIKLPKSQVLLPNSRRPYRASYTDGIHHGWDFQADKGTPVVAVDDAIVVRKVDGFLFSDLGRVKKGSDLTEEEKITNLDTLRGNQVWLKTMKGDVVFYAHLDTIFDSIDEGSFVSRGQPLGTIGSTGVPDKNYADFHVHLSIHKNPYMSSNAGKYTLMDYMKWPWYFKGDSAEEILKRQGDIFEE